MKYFLIHLEKTATSFFDASSERFLSAYKKLLHLAFSAKCNRWRPAEKQRANLDLPTALRYHPQYIRPLGVRPLTYPERVPKAWGFPFLEVRP